MSEYFNTRLDDVKKVCKSDDLLQLCCSMRSTASGGGVPLKIADPWYRVSYQATLPEICM